MGMLIAKKRQRARLLAASENQAAPAYDRTPPPLDLQIDGGEIELQTALPPEAEEGLELETSLPPEADGDVSEAGHAPVKRKNKSKNN